MLHDIAALHCLSIAGASTCLLCSLRTHTGLGRGFGGKGLDDVMNTDELLGEEDIEAALAATPGRPRSRPSSSGRGDSGSGGKARSSTPPEGKQAAASLLRSDSLMSARERNKLKRKAKALGRQDSTKPGGADAKGRVSRGPTMLRKQRQRVLQLQPSAHATSGGTCSCAFAGAGTRQLQLPVAVRACC